MKYIYALCLFLCCMITLGIPERTFAQFSCPVPVEHKVFAPLPARYEPNAPLVYTFEDWFVNTSTIMLSVSEATCSIATGTMTTNISGGNFALNCPSTLGLAPYRQSGVLIGSSGLIYTGFIRIDQKYDFQIKYDMTYTDSLTLSQLYCKHYEYQPVDVSRCGDGNTDTPPTDEKGKWTAELCDSGLNNGIIPFLPYNNPGLTATYCSKQCSTQTATGGYCGDGIIDFFLPKDPETCEKDSDCDALLFPVGSTCKNCTCTAPIVPTTPPTCNTVYSGQTVSDIFGYYPLCQAPSTLSGGSLQFNTATQSWSWSCVNPDNVSITCNAYKTQVPPTSLNTCNPVYSGQTFYASENFLEVSLQKTQLCLSGNVAISPKTSPKYDPILKKRSWTCDDGEDAEICTAQRTFCGDLTVQLSDGEECDLGNPSTDLTKCDNQCKKITPQTVITGSCDLTAQMIVYTGDTNKPIASCNNGAPGTVTISGTLVNPFRTWTCSGLNGGGNDICKTPISYCGDNVVGTGKGYISGTEQCDSGTTTNGTLPIVPYSATIPPNTKTYCDSTCQTKTLTGEYCGDMIKNGPEACDSTDPKGNICTNPGDVCNGCICEPKPKDNILCDSIYSGQSFYTTNTGFLDNKPLCIAGTPSNPIYDAQKNIWTWTCTSKIDPTKQISCTATRTFCGDTFVQDPPETCDPGPTVSSTCTPQCTKPFTSILFPDLVITKELISPKNIILSSTGQVIFKISYKNESGTGAVDVKIKDVLPAGLIYTSFTASSSAVTKVVGISSHIFSIGFLDKQESGYIYITTTPDQSVLKGICPATTMFNTAEIITTTSETNYNNNTASVPIPCQSPVCDALIVTPPFGSAPLASQFYCSGYAQTTSIQIKNNKGVLIYTIAGNSGSYIFPTIGNYTATCFMDGVTSNSCSKPIAVGGTCDSLTTNITPTTAAPFTGTLSCKGQGNIYTINLYQNNLLQKSWTKTGGSGCLVDYYFGTGGAYRAECLVDGRTRPMCDGKLVQGVDSLTQHTQQTQQDLIDTYIKSLIGKVDFKPLPITTPLIQQGIGFYDYLTAQIAQYQATMKYICEDPCITTFSLLPVPTFCGDGTKQTPNSSGYNEQCDHGFTGNNGIYISNGLVCGTGCVLVTTGVTGGGGGGGGSTTTTSSSTSQGGGGGGGGGSSPIIINPPVGGPTCGNAKRDPGEACDLGSQNGKGICSTNCTLRGISVAKKTSKPDSDVPACTFVDPPSLQLGEPMPLWRGYEGDTESFSQCDTGTIGSIDTKSLMCTFTIKNAKGEVVDTLSDIPCDRNVLKNASRYPSFLAKSDQATKDLLALANGAMVWDSKRVNLSTASFGEYTVGLDAIGYRICTPLGMRTEVYTDRVCQYNFAVTTPYMIQKGTTLSSLADDITLLSKFFALGGKQLLADISFRPLALTSKSDTLTTLLPFIQSYIAKATQPVIDATNIFQSLSKVPGQEIYVADRTFVFDVRSVVNKNKPTVLILKGEGEIVIKGSLSAQMMILAPQGSIRFENTDCDRQDIVQGILVAKEFVSNTIKNTDSNAQWCKGGGLVIDGMLIGGAESIQTLKNTRRSTLSDWFNASSQKDSKIFDGAALRIQSNPKLRESLPSMVTQVIQTLRK